MGSPSPRARRPRKLHLEELEPRLVLSGTQPSAAEQMFLELLNDARANPAAYGASIGVDLSYIAPSPPLAIDPRIEQAAQYHSLDMNNRAYFAHTDPDGRDPGARLTMFGYPWNTWGESIAAGSVLPTPAEALKELIIDAGVPDLGHRNQLLSNGPDYTGQNQVGVGIVQNGSGPYVNYYTIDTAGSPASPGPFITGVVYNDLNGNGHYDIGEGLGGVTITVTGVGSTTTWSAGGYDIAVAPGTYTVTASGGPFQVPVTQTVTVGLANVRLNFNPVPLSTGQLQAWVTGLYQDLLHRTPAAVEVNGWVGALQGAGLTRDQVANLFLRSQEYTTGVVVSLYQQYLHRAPDAGGLAGWVAALEAGMDVAMLRESILGSPEYWSLHGGTAKGLVQGLYTDLLGRSPVGHEADSWIAQVAAGNEGTTLTGLIFSTEFGTRLINGMYQTYLRRPTDSSGLAYFLGVLNVNTEQYVLEQLLDSYEYLNGTQVW